MATKKSGVPKVAGKAAKQDPALMAVDLAIRLLSSPAVQASLKWASNETAALARKGASRLEDAKDKIAEHFGQQGLERRLAAVQARFDLVFGSPEAPGGGEVARVLDALKVALAVAGDLPLLDRKKAHHAIDNALDSLERQFVDAVVNPLHRDPSLAES